MNETFILALNNVINLALAKNSELDNLTVEAMKNKADLLLVSRFLIAGAKASRAERAELDPNIAISVSDLVQL